MSSSVISQSATNNISSKLISDVINLSNSIEYTTPDGLFGRSCRVKTNNLTFSMDEYDIEISSDFDDTLYANETQISIYNLTANTIAGFKNGNQIVVEAGYKENTGVIFSGIIDKVITEFDNNDKKTTIYALDKVFGDSDIKTSYAGIVTTGKTVAYTDALGRLKKVSNKYLFPTTSYKINTKASYILKDLLNMTGIPIAMFQVKRDHTYIDKVSLSGSLSENIKKYSQVCGVSTYISNGKLYCHDIKDVKSSILTIDVDHGLVDRIEEFEEEQTNDDITEIITGIKLKTLLINQIQVGSVLDVKSINKTGQFVVKKCSFIINDSDFYSEIVAVSMK